MTWFHESLRELPDADTAARDAVAGRAAEVLRPAGALQRLDDIAVHVGGWRGTTEPRVDRPTVLVFAGDHGVAAADVSAYPADVTAHMLAAVRSHRATINAIARSVGATLSVHDVGVGRPTGDIRHRAALDPARVDEIATVASAAVDSAADDGADLVVVGELGIGNTTVAAAIAALLLGGTAADWVGRGTGVDDEGLARKRVAVDTAVRRVGTVGDPIDAWREVGGAEFVAMAAAVVRSRQRRIPVVLDGFIATAAVLPLVLARPDALDHCLVGHVSAEPGHRRILDHLGRDPLLDLGLRLGEGSGALAAVPLVRLACACVTEVATFGEWFGGGPTEAGGE
ncbi:MAG: nicotinate-nucleotide--dimethylbenzimidazole phosphoribosyltransferase [Actinomycetota bacterium]